MITRYLSALTSGTLVTFAILYAMQGLIQLQPGAASDHSGGRPIILTKTTIERSPPPPQPRTIRKEDLARNVPPPGRPRTGTGPTIPVSTQSIGPGPVTTTLGDLGEPDGPLISIVRVQPTYPPPAAQRGLEGWVDVRFDVTPNGLTTNIEVLRSSDRIFEKAARKAAERFRFKAPVVGGVPQHATGIEYRFRFDMEE